MDPHPVHLHRRFDPEVLISLKAIRTGNPSELILQELDGRGVAPLKEVLETAGLEPECARPVLSEMEGRGELVFLSGDISSAGALIASRKSWENILTRIAEELARHHDAHPLRLGMPREELRARLGLDTETFGAVVLNAAAAGILQETARGIRKPGSAPHLTNAQEQAVQSLLAQFARDPFNPPSVRQCVDAVGQEVFAMLVERGTLRQVSEEAVFLGETYREIVARITEVLQEKGALTVAQTRDLFGSSRKSILPLLEYLDAQGITKREGDVRRLA
jgi:selenocysteine-specific elongation factor